LMLFLSWSPDIKLRLKVSLKRYERPEALRSNILGRLPPLRIGSSLVTPLDNRPQDREKIYKKLFEYLH